MGGRLKLRAGGGSLESAASVNVAINVPHVSWDFGEANKPVQSYKHIYLPPSTTWLDVSLMWSVYVPRLNHQYSGISCVSISERVSLGLWDVQGWRCWFELQGALKAALTQTAPPSPSAPAVSQHLWLKLLPQSEQHTQMLMYTHTHTTVRHAYRHTQKNTHTQDVCMYRKHTLKLDIMKQTVMAHFKIN